VREGRSGIEKRAPRVRSPYAFFTDETFRRKRVATVFSQMAFEIALGVESTHAESFNNLGVLESRKGNVESARANFAAAAANAEWAHEPFYNHALVAFRQGDFQEAFERVEKALEAFPEHAEGLELRKQLVKQFTVL
jgi:tetratricopeptide repeat protein 8